MMARRRAARHYMFEPEEDKEQVPIRGRKAARGAESGKATAGVVTAPTSRTESAAGAVRRAPSKRLRGLAPDATSTPLSPILSSTAQISPRRPHKSRAPPPLAPRSLSLADLPAEIIERIGEFLLPVISPSWPDGSRTSSKEWTGRISDILALRSACRATWTGLSAVVNRCWRFKMGELDDDDIYPTSRLAAIGKAPKMREEPDGGAFVVLASRIRHFSYSTNYDDVFNDVDGCNGPLCDRDVAVKISLMHHLVSFAYVHSKEDLVVEGSPYRTRPIAVEVITALAKLPHLRDLYFCGASIDGDVSKALERAFTGNKIPFPALCRITLSTCDDLMLQLLRLGRPLEEARVWRDFAAPLAGPALTDWWPPSLWETVEEVDVVGLTGAAGRRVLDEWLNSLILTRSVQPPVFVPLRSLRIFEPHESSVIRRDFLLSFALLPQLRHLTLFVWSDHNFGPNLVKEIHEALPDLEELGLGLESEQLTWWQGPLSNWSNSLALFPDLRVFTWNYSPYSDLDFEDTRRYVTPLVRSAFVRLPDLLQLRWFGTFVHLRRRPPINSWEWVDDDPTYVPPLPTWAEERLAAKDVADWSSSTSDVRHFAVHTKPRQPLAELDVDTQTSIFQSSEAVASPLPASTSPIADWLEDAPEFEDKYGPVRRSDVSMLDRLRATKAADKGKGRARSVEVDDWEETFGSEEEGGGAAEDSGFFGASAFLEMEDEGVAWT